MRLVLIAVLLALGAPALSAELSIKVQIPRLNVAEYHRPYVAIWIEDQDRRIAAHLAVWYKTEPGKEDGRQWLKDLRQWWRRGGRERQMPIDGVTGATRPAGEHTLTFKSTHPALSRLAPGKYELAVEAAREVGGRELLRLPFEWPGSESQHVTARGTSELGTVSLDVKPDVKTD